MCVDPPASIGEVAARLDVAGLLLECAAERADRLRVAGALQLELPERDPRHPVVLLQLDEPL